MNNDLPFRLAVSRLQQAGSIRLPSRGYSMFPTIRPSDECMFVPIHKDQLTIGRIVLFGDSNGNLIGHRLIRIETKPTGTIYICKGDTNLLPDEPIPYERIVGRLSTLNRSQPAGHIKTVPADDLGKAIWGTILIHFPFLSKLLRRWIPKH
jgi:signal peptidase